MARFVALIASLGALLTIASHVAHLVAFVAASGWAAAVASLAESASLSALGALEVTAGLVAFAGKVTRLLALVTDVIAHFFLFFVECLF